ncbi:hypothetical protein Pfo_000554 [Paulownia fortunei]|nr:hypothetical protein Pfo_000554 [Paulownia fortunei]
MNNKSYPLGTFSSLNTFSLNWRHIFKHKYFFIKLEAFAIHPIEIPSAFALSIQEALPDKVVLRHGYNNLWKVKVAKVGDKLYLQDGWPKFVEDNSIKGGDLLVFEYLSNGLFDTKIHGSSACEKKGIGAFKVTEEKTKSVREEDEASDDIHMLESERDDEEEEEIPSNNYSLKRKRGTSCKEKLGRIRRVADIYGTEIFRSGLAPEPKNPFFITKINPRRKGELYIPKDIINAQNLNLPEDILMVDPNGRKWSAKRKIWRDGRTYYTQGWRRLCQSNFVEEDDVCICEFVQRGRRLCMNVSFVRANQV